MLGFSYGEILLLIGVTAAVIGPKDLPRIARTAGRMAGRAVGYVQLVRGQFDNVMQQSQARQVHKELQDTMAKLDAIRYEIRGLSLINPGPMTRGFMENPTQTIPPPDSGNDEVVSEKPVGDEELKKRIEKIVKNNGFRTSGPVDLQAQATSYEKLAEAEALKAASLKKNVEKLGLDDESGLFAVLPVSAETAKLLPNRKDNASGSDILLEAVLEAEVARNAKDFFAEAQNHIPAK